MHNTSLVDHLEKIPSLVAVIRLGSISKAAKMLSISQPALSQTVKTLENALGVELLTRSKKGVHPTPEGEMIYNYGKKLIADLDLLQINLFSGSRRALTRIKIGTHEALAVHIWPEIIKQFQKKHPSISLSLVSGRMDELNSLLKNSQIDVIFGVNSDKLIHTNSTQIYKETFCFYRGKKITEISGEQLKTDIIEKSRLKNIPVLTDCNAYLSTNNPLSKLLYELGLHSTNYFHLNSFQAAVKLAEIGTGIALLPKRIGDNLKSLKEIKVKGLTSSVFNHKIVLSTFGKPNKDVQILKQHLVKYF